MIFCLNKAQFCLYGCRLHTAIAQSTGQPYHSFGGLASWGRLLELRKSIASIIQITWKCTNSNTNKSFVWFYLATSLRGEYADCLVLWSQRDNLGLPVIIVICNTIALKSSMNTIYILQRHKWHEVEIQRLIQTTISNTALNTNENKNSVKHNEVGKSATAGCKNLVVTGAASTA